MRNVFSWRRACATLHCVEVYDCTRDPNLTFASTFTGSLRSNNNSSSNNSNNIILRSVSQTGTGRTTEEETAAAAARAPHDTDMAASKGQEYDESRGVTEPAVSVILLQKGQAFVGSVTLYMRQNTTHQL